ncbi:L,D-transpeptidase family protein [Candidatus Dojkabacteria bacterium]|nr:L,D-transpeptidase family protein [Candidatus Dojkabacteria bacterium]
MKISETVQSRKQPLKTVFWVLFIAVFVSGIWYLSTLPVWSKTDYDFAVTKEFSNELETDNVNIYFQGETYDLEDLGVEIKPVEVSISQKIKGLFSKTSYYEIAVDDEVFLSKIEQFNNEFGTEPVNSQLYVDKKGDLQISESSSGTKYVASDIKEVLVNSIKSESSKIYIVPETVFPTITKESLADDLQILNYLTKPIIITGDGSTLVLTRELLISFWNLECTSESVDQDIDNTNDTQVSLNVCVQKDVVSSTVIPMLNDLYNDILNSKKTVKNHNGSFEYRTCDYGPDLDLIISDLTNLLERRLALLNEYNGRIDESRLIGNDTITVSFIDLPGTDGTYVTRYIEIDQTQQKMYLWQDGQLYKSYGISGSYDDYAVYGVYSVMNKSTNAWSDVAKKWMPYWMAYYYDPRQKAMLGIHELVWWDDENGVRHVEPSSNIGTPKSTGCIRLDRGAAKEVYDWAEIGTPILIHP